MPSLARLILLPCVCAVKHRIPATSWHDAHRCPFTGPSPTPSDDAGFRRLDRQFASRSFSVQARGVRCIRCAARMTCSSGHRYQSTASTRAARMLHERRFSRQRVVVIGAVSRRPIGRLFRIVAPRLSVLLNEFPSDGAFVLDKPRSKLNGNFRRTETIENPGQQHLVRDPDQEVVMSSTMEVILQMCSRKHGCHRQHAVPDIFGTRMLIFKPETIVLERQNPFRAELQGGIRIHLVLQQKRPVPCVTDPLRQGAVASQQPALLGHMKASDCLHPMEYTHVGRAPSTSSCSTASGRKKLLDLPVRGHALRLDVVLAGGLQVGVAQEIRRDADLLGGGIDQLRHGAVAKQVRPDGVAERLPGAQGDLGANRAAGHGLAGAIDPQVLTDIHSHAGCRCR